MKINKSILSIFLPAALLLAACRPADVVNPVTPVTPVTPQDPTPDDPTPTDPSGEAVSMTVCTFNLRYANTADTFPDGSSAAWSVRAPAVKKFVEAAKPDLIGLQEIRKEQSQYFTSNFGTEYGYYDVGRDSGSGSSVASAGGEGVGVLYKKDRFEVVQKDFFWLDETPRTLPAKNSDGTYGAWNSACRRVTVYVKLKDKKHNNSIVYFFPTHYDHKSETARKNAADLMITQIKNICKVDDIKNADCIIFHVGDLNTSYENAQLKSLKDNMDYARLSVESKDRYTGTFNGFKNQDSGSLIDHIYFGGKSIVPKEYWVDKTNYGVPFISDHYPVLFRWEYK